MCIPLLCGVCKGGVQNGCSVHWQGRIYKLSRAESQRVHLGMCQERETPAIAVFQWFPSQDRKRPPSISEGNTHINSWFSTGMHAKKSKLLWDFQEVLDSYRREALAVGEPLATEKACLTGWVAGGLRGCGSEQVP